MSSRMEGIGNGSSTITEPTPPPPQPSIELCRGSSICFIQHIVDKFNITEVLDVGCGNITKQHHSFMNWSKAHYMGIDICEDVVDDNRHEVDEQFRQTTNMESAVFECVGGEDTLPPEFHDADLVIISDLLGYLSNG